MTTRTKLPLPYNKTKSKSEVVDRNKYKEMYNKKQND